ncbi:MAG: hypothetical protein RLZ94_1705, partial [Actinomycetota bacterium]
MAPIQIIGARSGSGRATSFGTSTAQAGITIGLQVDQRSVNAAYKRLNPYKYKYFSKQVGKIWFEAARIPQNKMKRALPTMSGNLAKSVRVRRNRLRVKEMAASTVGPTARHRHLYILGTKPHSLAGGSSGRKGKGAYSAFPYRGKKYNLKLVESTPG